MNSDSRPDSVLDEQENTCDPPETPLPETESKETDEKLVDPLQIANPPSAVSNVEKMETQDENITQEATKHASTSENQETRAESKQDSTVATVNPATEAPEEKPNVTTLPSTSIPSTTTTTASNVTATVSQEAITAKCESPVLAAPAYAPKEQEMLSTIANIKQEVNMPPTTTDYPAKEMPIYIKKEPSEEAADNSNTNSNSNEPADLKITTEIKSENKCGLDLSDHENKYQESSSMPNQQIKFAGPPTTEAQVKYPPESLKYSEPLKYGPPLHGHVINPAAIKYGPPGSEMGKFHIDSEGKYEPKPFMDPLNKYPDPSIRPYPIEGPGNEAPQMLKNYPSEPTDLKYPGGELQSKYTPTVAESIKYESGESSIIKRPPYPEPHQPIRSPYDPSQMIKYGDPMQKFHGMPPIGGGLPDMKHISPADLKYRPPENLIKSQFTADNLIKTNSYGEYPTGIKYPPAESPIDASARSTPNQDSQSSNSNLAPQLPPPPHASISSSQINSPHLNHSAHLPPTTGPPMLIGAPPGIPPSPLAHLPANHPSMMPPHSSPSTTPVSSHGPLHLPPSTASSPMQQPLGLVTQGSNSMAGIPPPSGPIGHPGLHRPHQDIPPLMHHPAAVFSTGLPPPHSSCHPQIPSPALSVSRGDPERHEQRRMEALHGSSPGLLPPGPGASILGHPSIPLHLPSSLPPSAIPLLPPHHPGHLGPPLLPPSVTNAPLSLIGPPISTAANVPEIGRRTPTSAPPSSSHSTTAITSSAFSRTSPSVQFSNLPPAGHRPVSPTQPPPSSLTRASPLHLSHHSSASALNAAAVAAAERDRHALMRQQSPHMTPPPVSSSSLIASPLSKMFGAQTQQPRSSPPPSHHLRPGASPPVMRHPQMPLPLPLMGPAPGMPPQMGMHPAHNPYSHHLIHPMFYPHQPNPFNSPYHAYPYGHPGFQYIKPPHGPGIDPAVLQPHPSATARLEETAAHVEKQLNSANSQSAKVTLNYLFVFAPLPFILIKIVGVCE